MVVTTTADSGAEASRGDLCGQYDYVRSNVFAPAGAPYFIHSSPSYQVTNSNMNIGPGANVLTIQRKPPAGRFRIFTTDLLPNQRDHNLRLDYRCDLRPDAAGRPAVIHGIGAGAGIFELANLTPND